MPMDDFDWSQNSQYMGGGWGQPAQQNPYQPAQQPAYQGSAYQGTAQQVYQPAANYAPVAAPSQAQTGVTYDTGYNKPLQMDSGGASSTSAAPNWSGQDYYNMYTGAQYNQNYQVPDWLRASGIAFNANPDQMAAFFTANPQYAEDWKNITSGGLSKFSTDGSGLVKTNLNNLPQEVADHYRQNVPELLANEGFGFDPTLAYMNYYKGGSSIGVNPKTQNVATFLRDNKYTPNGIVGNNNLVGYNATPYGAGTASLTGSAGPGINLPKYGPGGSGGANAGYQGAGYSSAPGPATSSGGSVSGSTSSGQNPYSQTLADMLASTMTNNWQRRIAPQLASQAALVGGFGGSRQGVAEANSASDLNMGIGSAIANLLSNNYNSSLNYDLGMANNQLGWGNLGLGYAGLDRQINNDNLNWQLQGANLGMSIQDRMLQQALLGLSQGTNIQNTPLNYWQQIANQINGIGQGYGSSTQSGGGGNPLMGAIGGAQLGRQIGNWWGSNQPGTSWYSGNQGMAD